MHLKDLKAHEFHVISHGSKSTITNPYLIETIVNNIYTVDKQVKTCIYLYVNTDRIDFGYI